MRLSGSAAVLTAAVLVCGSAAGFSGAADGFAIEAHAIKTYQFTDIDGNTVSTGSGKPTAVVFGKPGCWNSRQTLTYIAQTDWISEGDVTVIYADIVGTTEADVRTFREETSGCEAIHYCTDPYCNILMWSFVKGEYSVTCPVIVYFDGEGNQIGVTQGYQAADDIRGKLMNSAPPAVSPTDTLGDLDGDGTVSASDAADLLIALAKMGAGEENPLTDAQQKAADVDGSGTADAADATIMLQYAAFIGAGGSRSLEEFLK